MSSDHLLYLYSAVDFDDDLKLVRSDSKKTEEMFVLQLLQLIEALDFYDFVAVVVALIKCFENAAKQLEYYLDFYLNYFLIVAVIEVVDVVVVVAGDDENESLAAVTVIESAAYDLLLNNAL